ncbi:LacI family DNA-binding transcriptional regulator [Mammaliicoccus vitulinus]|uniref:LacI family DNA-binding transcriptional regulator n=1 Tax=Mammaliicoccus vitulinus TaxID=71237 RepID=UPI0002DF7067|nr:LacI family DNA-binding transcriptional regulator [Mammaliicoccus vitulinus]MBO3077863.1 LacI family DNA-binding transcriptional regulator [Mammaliicoccus vitulinus]MEB7658169.1 LacI family DNA-binding transcriptional regulator [Mammaliicoccus vitulinus]QTN11520.1 LacI family transcriptional regulator [Mammaliicoccus vitulinus]WQK88650.1 LacI family DNA-binding transcriptional regulator [Mammaliicoccus vitulinus]
MKTIKDIAQMAGVSKSTVSRYLNGGSISKNTKEKIHKVVEETGYKPNQFAQSLKAKRTGLIGAIVPRLDSYATTETLKGIETSLLKQDVQTMIVNTDLCMEREIDSIYMLAKRKVDGIILMATHISEEHMKAIKAVDCPIVIVGQSHADLLSIVHDDYNAGKQVANWLIKHNKHHITYVGVSEHDIAVGKTRKDGLFNPLKEHGIQPKFIESSFSIKDAQQIGENITIREDEVIVAATDNIALGIYHTLLKAEGMMPTIIGFGGNKITEIVAPTIQTVKFKYNLAGETAVDVLNKCINNQPVEKLSVIDTYFEGLDK